MNRQHVQFPENPEPNNEEVSVDAPNGAVSFEEESLGQPSQSTAWWDSPSTLSVHGMIPKREDFSSLDAWYVAVLEFVLLIDGMDEQDDMFLRQGQRTTPPSSQSSSVESEVDNNDNDDYRDDDEEPNTAASA